MKQQREEHADERERQARHDRDRLHEAAELRGEDQVDEDHREPERCDRRLEGLLHVLLLAADVEAVARGKLGLHLVDDLLHVVADVAGRPALDVRVERDAALQLLALDDLRTRRLDDLGDLPQRHHAQLAVRAALVRRDREVREIGREAPPVLRQLHVHFVVVAVRRQPVAHGVAGEQRPQRAARPAAR